MTAHIPTAIYPLQPTTLEALYYGDSIARRIVSAPVDEAFRQGFSVSYSGDNENSRELCQRIEERAKELGLEAKAKQAAKLGRLLGGSGLLLGTNGGTEQARMPLAPESVRSLDWITVVDRRDLVIDAWQPPRTEHHFAEHAFYRPVTREQIALAITDQLHASRIVPFGGIDTAVADRKKWFGGWDASTLQPVWEVLRSFNSSHQSVDSMLSDGSIGVLQLPELWKLVAENGLSTLETRISTMQQYMWSGRTIPLDSDENFQWIERKFAGIHQLLQEKQALVAAAAEMPITVLFGRSPAGENSTGEHDMKNWHAVVASWQRTRYGPALAVIIQILARELGAQDPEAFGVEWPNLEQLTLKEQAELEKLHTEADNSRKSQGFPAESILLHRYGRGQYQVTAPLLTDEDKKELQEKRKNPPPPPPQPPPKEEEEDPADLVDPQGEEEDTE